MNKKVDIKFITFLIMLVIIIILELLLVNYKADINDKFYYAGNVLQESNEVLKEVNEGTLVEQKFIASSDNLQKIYLNFESYKDDKNCGGTVLIGIKDSNGAVIKETEIQRNVIRENSIYKFSFKKQKKSQGQEYTVYIKFKSRENYETFYSLKMNPNSLENWNLFINGETQSSNLCMQDMYKNNKEYLAFVAVSVLVVVLVIGISICLFKKKEISIEKAFIRIIPIIGIMMLLGIPILRGHDELYHWYRCYEVSTGHLTTGLENGVEGTEMPGSVIQIFPGWKDVTYQKVWEKSDVKIDKNDTGILDSATSAVYCFVQYVPQAIGIIIARIFTNRMLIIAYFARFFNLIISVLILYYAIKLMPFGKKIMFIPMLIPIFIECIATVSPDALTTSISFLYIAYILNIVFNENKKVGKKESIVLFILSIIVALCKIVYLPLVGLMLIIPKEKYEGKNYKNKYKNILIIGAIAIAANLIWLKISSKYLALFTEGDSTFQVMEILKHPVKYIQILLYSIDLNGMTYIRTLFGGQLGWDEVINLNSIVPYTLFILCIIITVIDNDVKKRFNIKQQIIIAFIVIAIIGLIFTSLFVQWTAIGSTGIAGVQGRYFIPILPLIMLLIGNNIKIFNKYKERNIIKCISILGLILYVYVILSIFITFI